MATWLSSLSQDLFWDVSIDSVDPKKNLRWLVERIVTRGRWEDWLLLSRHVPREELRAVLPRLRLTGREKHFLEIYLGAEHA